MSKEIGNRFIVLDSSEETTSKERIPIILGPGRAFGSGDHETTRSCLEELETLHDLRSAKVLDLGCGTGILSIATAKMGAHMVLALDPDPDAIKTCLKNIKLNRIEKIVCPLQGELEAVKKVRFDLIMANLYGDILLTLVKDIPPLLKTGGRLMLSGIQFEYTYEVKTRFTLAGCQLLKSRYLEEYTTLVFRKKPV